MSKSNLPLTLNARGANVVYLLVSLSKHGYTIPKRELEGQVFGVSTQDALLTLQAKYYLSRTGNFDEVNKAASALAKAEKGTQQNSVQEHFFFDYGLPANS